VEIPLGQPVLSDLVAEIYGPPEASIDSLVPYPNESGQIWKKPKAWLMLMNYSMPPHDKVHFQLNREKAALVGSQCRASCEKRCASLSHGQKCRHRSSGQRTPAAGNYPATTACAPLVDS